MIQHKRHIAVILCAYVLLFAGWCVIRYAVWELDFAHDERWYMSCATSIAQGNGAVGWVGAPGGPRHGYCVLFPPSYPTIAAGFIHCGLSPRTAGLAVNACAGIVAVIALFYLLLRTSIPAVGATWLVLGYILHPDSFRVYVQCWSEPMALAVAFCALLALDKRPITTGLLAGFAYTVRNAMGALCLTVGAYYLWHRRWKNAVLCAVGGLIGCGWLLLCNRVNWGEFLPYHTPRPSPETMSDCVYHSLRLGLLYLSPLGVLLAFIRPRNLPAGVGWFAAISLGLLYYCEIKYHISPIYYRFLAPLYPMLLVFIASRWEHRAMQVFIAVWPVWAFAQFAAVLI